MTCQQWIPDHPGSTTDTSGRPCGSPVVPGRERCITHQPDEDRITHQVAEFREWWLKNRSRFKAPAR